jgi:hypothetical protein
MNESLPIRDGAIKLAWNYFNYLHQKFGIVFIKTQTGTGINTGIPYYPTDPEPNGFDKSKLPPPFRKMNRRERRSAL